MCVCGGGGDNGGREGGNQRSKVTVGSGRPGRSGGLTVVLCEVSRSGSGQGVRVIVRETGSVGRPHSGAV